MNVLLPSEIARLVLGYLTSTKCTAARTKFLDECPHLREYVFYLENGHEYPTNISGHDLVHYLNIGFQYTQYITCGDPLKCPLPTLPPFPAFYGYAANRGGFTPGSGGQESPAQQGVRNGTPLTSPRVTAVPYRTTPRGGWPNASPATIERRSPADSLIDVTTVTEPPSSEPQIPPAKRLSEAAIQTDDFPQSSTINIDLVAPSPIPGPSNVQENQQQAEKTQGTPAQNATSGNDVFEISTGFHAQSPKRKPVAPKKRAIVQPSDIILSPPTRESGRRVINEMVHSQLAEKLAENINEVSLAYKPTTSLSCEEVSLSDSQLGAHLPDSLLSDVISKTLSDPVMEELAQFVASSSVDLETPNATPLKGMLLKTPFKQIAEDAAIDAHIIAQPVVQSTNKPGQFVQLQPGRVNVVASEQSKAIADSMKIVVNSSPARPTRRLPIRTIPAPRKPSPKVSPPESTCSTLLGERSQIGSTTTSLVSSVPIDFTKSKINPLPGTHIRALDFGLTDNAARYPHLHANMPTTETPVSSAAPKVRIARKRKTIILESPKKYKRTSGRGKNTETNTTPTAEVSTAGNQPVVLSIPDQGVEQSVSEADPKDNKTGTIRRQAILVEAIPSSKKTAPRRVAASRAKPRAGKVSGQKQKSPTVVLNTSNDFLMPSTPKKPETISKQPKAASKSKVTKTANSTGRSVSSSAPTSSSRSSAGESKCPLVNSSNDVLNFDISALLDKIHKPSALDNSVVCLKK